MQEKYELENLFITKCWPVSCDVHNQLQIDCKLVL